MVSQSKNLFRIWKLRRQKTSPHRTNIVNGVLKKMCLRHNVTKLCYNSMEITKSNSFKLRLQI